MFMKRVYLLFIIVALQLCVSAGLAENFPKPVILQADVDFWLRVYTEADTRGGYIHDSRNLSVVYERISLRGSPRANRKHIKKIKAKYVLILRSLASGKRKNLSNDEQRVLSMWGEGVTNKRLLSAASDIRFQRGQSDRFRRGLERSGEWRAYINDTFKQLSLPIELSVLPHVESSFNPDAYSHVGAAGLWQFIRSTGKRYMQIDHIVDERMDPFAATVAAAKLLRHNYQLTQSWPLALTAYNHGVASMRRAINKLGTRDIATIVRKYKGRSFGFASRNFYVAFLAALEVDNNPDKYFTSIAFSKPVDYEKVTLDSYYFAKDIAKHLNIKKSHLKKHNRALLDSVWHDSKRIPKGYVLRVPKALLASSATKLFATIPKELRYKVQTPDEFHYVKSGDTISEIADAYGHRVKDILVANNMSNSHYIRAGQKLRLPVKDGLRKQQVVLSKPVKTTPLQVEKEKKVLAKAPLEESTEPVKQDTAKIVTSIVVNNENAINEDIEDQQSGDLDVSVVAEPELSEIDAPILLSDPADYTVDQNDTIEVQASETLGHYAEWLDIRASRLRQINNMKFAKPVVLGKRIKLDFSEVSQNEFEKRRIAYQKSLQGAFFAQYRLDSTYQHTIKRGESLWVLALRKFKVPVWLLWQHNPDVNFHHIRPGVKITVPNLIEI